MRRVLVVQGEMAVLLSSHTSNFGIFGKVSVNIETKPPSFIWQYQYPYWGTSNAGYGETDDLEVGNTYGRAGEFGEIKILSIEGDRICYNVRGLKTLTPLYINRFDFKKRVEKITKKPKL